MARRTSRELDCVIIGAGPAGVGTAIALSAIGDLTWTVVERGRVGQTFLDWPAEQRFLTPSFTGNGFGATDLNSVHPLTSPAFSLGVDYPDGPGYARYLAAVADHFGLAVRPRTEVHRIHPEPRRFRLATSRGALRARTVVWAGGEFGDPGRPAFPGADLGQHASTEPAWAPRKGRVLVIGGYESGIDLACHQVGHGAEVTVVDPEHPWDARQGSDPSFLLAPRTRQRLRAAQQTGRLSLIGTARVTGLTAIDGGFRAALSSGAELITDTAPIIATGYGSGLGPAGPLFERRPDGWPQVDANDESTTTPGIFLAGAGLRHDHLRFCFVYKFRQRFAQVARAIAERLGRDAGGLEYWRSAGMWTDDLSCCGTECAC